MKNFLSRLSTKKWLFAISIYIVFYSLFMLAAYNSEVEAIRKQSLNHFGGDITANLGFFEVLKSHGFDYWKATYIFFFMVFIPYLLTAAYFFDFKNETHTGWRRVYLSAQILIPALFSICLDISTLHMMSIDFVNFFILFFGISEVVILILIKCFIWVREGFSAQAN